MKWFIVPKGNTDKKFNSRRYISLWLLTLVFTLMFVGPPIAMSLFSLFNVNMLALTLISEQTYSYLMGFLWGAYLTSDYGTKRLGQYLKDRAKLENEEHVEFIG